MHNSDQTNIAINKPAIAKTLILRQAIRDVLSFKFKKQSLAWALSISLSPAAVAQPADAQPTSAAPGAAQATQPAQETQAEAPRVAQGKHQSMAQEAARETPQKAKPSATHKTSQQQWLTFIDTVLEQAKSSGEIQGQAHELRSRRAETNAERGDTGLNLVASYSDYPNGLGGGQSDADNLESYSELRLNYRLLDQILRKGDRVDAARYREQQAEILVKASQSALAIELANESATAWSERFQRQALKRALTAIQSAKQKLELAANASMPEITNATLENEAQTLILHKEITSAFDRLSPFDSRAPQLPLDYTALPLTAPDSQAIIRAAKHSTEANILKLEANALEAEARALSGNGVELDVYAGHVSQDRSGSEGVTAGSASDSGNQFGAVLTVPLGSEDSHRKKSRHWQSKARHEEARAAVESRQRELIQLRNQWSEAVSNLSRRTEQLRQEGRMLNQMQTRADHPGAGRAPQPWELNVAEARFWLRVADTWQARGEWAAHVLSWAVIDPKQFRASLNSGMKTNIHSLCAPIKDC